jgi:uncharacterized DUF497 family protein
MDDIPRKMKIRDWEFRLVPGTTKIEYDENKELSNRKKHGYSLESAVSLLERTAFPVGEPLHYVSPGFKEGGEVRHNHMIVDEFGKVLFMVTTMRPHETVRIISVRRANESEREEFFRQKGFREGF